MIIDDQNCECGNRAMASVLLLYCHMLDEGGFTHDQTVYLDQRHFNGYDFINTEVREHARHSLAIDGDLIATGAIIYLLCDLNDMIAEYELNFLQQPLTKKIIQALKAADNSRVPELPTVIGLMRQNESCFDHKGFQSLLQLIYEKHIVSYWAGKLSGTQRGDSEGRPLRGTPDL